VFGRRLTVCDMTTVIGMPVRVLATGSSMEVEDGVNPLSSTNVNDPIEVLETGLFKDTRVHIICELLRNVISL
jgi:hypothetical protein